MDDIVSKLAQSGFKPTLNRDEEFPAVKGSYRIEIKGIKTFYGKDESGGPTEKEAYNVEYRVTETLDGDKADGRIFFGRHRFGGQRYNKSRQLVDVTPEDAGKAIMALINDVYTCGVELDRSSTEAMEASFLKAQGATGYMKAWHFPSNEDADKRVQQFKIVTEKDLSKAAKAGSSASSAIPF